MVEALDKICVSEVQGSRVGWALSLGCSSYSGPCQGIIGWSLIARVTTPKPRDLGG